MQILDRRLLLDNVAGDRELLAEMACRLETAGRDRRLEGVPDAVRQLGEEMKRLGPELASLVESGSE